MSSESILFTANEDLAAPLFQFDAVKKTGLLHLPLETYEYYPEPEEGAVIQDKLDDFAFVVHANLRNARYFLQWVEERHLLKQVQQRVNLAADEPTAVFLEDKEIPAILPRKDAKPIDVLEFLLRISRDGSTLYPTTDQKTGEIPGLLQELEMPVNEFTICRETSVPPVKLEKYRKRVISADVKSVLFHNRTSILRIRKAFPELDLSSIQRIAGSKGVAEKLKEEGLEADVQAHGSWASIAGVL
ncbi:MAG: hypothetical protein WEA56_15280 [Balneolaceae bacterium]